MKTILCILAVLVLTAGTADAYVRRHPVARVAAGTALVAATARGWNQPYYGGGYGGYSYGAYPYSGYAYPYGGYPYSYGGYPYSYTGSPFGYGGFPYTHGWSDDY